MKFKTGGFFPFLRQPVSTLSNTSIAATRIFPRAVDVAAQIFGRETSAGMVATAAQFLRANLPPLDLPGVIHRPCGRDHRDRS